jgi:hypothetical protein
MQCETCKNAIITNSRLVITSKGIRKVVRGYIHCDCEKIRTYTYTGDDLVCNEFIQKSVDKKK